MTLPTMLLLFCALVALTHGVPLESRLVSDGVSLSSDSLRLSGNALGAQCECSPTGARFEEAVKQLLIDELVEIEKLQRERQLGASYQALDKCYKRFSVEACTNAEASLRTSADAVTYCVYDLQTGSNLAEEQKSGRFDYQELVKCTSTKKTPEQAKAPVEKALETDRPVINDVPRATSTPSPSALSAEKPRATTTPPSKNNVAADVVVTTTSQPLKPSSIAQTPAPAATKSPALNDAPVATTSAASNESSRAANETSSTDPPLATTTPTAASTPVDTDASSEVARSTARSPTNEGCVAIEHLEGYALQYKKHVRRPVLCANAFCATPNHAIYVDTVYTSMKRLCATQWQCTRDVKLVNNLRIVENTRAIVSQRIIVTPYDYRVPIVLCWIAQFFFEIAHLIASPPAFLTAVLAIIATLATFSIARPRCFL